MQNANPLPGKPLLRYMIAGLALLVVANVINHVAGKPFWGITRFIDLGSDDNIAAWYSSVLLAIAGLLAYQCSLCARRENVRGSLPFLLFAGLLFFMSCDEIARFHEIVGVSLSNYFDLASKVNARHSLWVYTGGPLIVALFAAFAFVLWPVFRQVRGTGSNLLIGFGLIILGGVVLEFSINFLNKQELKWLWDIEIIAEDSLEMIGTIFIAYSLLIWRDGVCR